MKYFLQSFTTTITIFALIIITILPQYAVAQQNSDVSEAFRATEAIIRSGADGLDTCAKSVSIDDTFSTAVGIFKESYSFIKNLLDGVPIQDAGGNDILAEINQANDQAQIISQCYDTLASLTSAETIEQLNQNVITFINGVEDGVVKFNQDPEALLRDVAAVSMREFLREAPIVSQTCSIYRQNALESIYTQYNEQFGGSIFLTGVTSGNSDDPRAQGNSVPNSDVPTLINQLVEDARDNQNPGCALEQYAGSPEAAQAFVEGDFSRGGWDAWLSLAFDPGSSRVNAEAELSNQLNTKINQDGEEFLEQLNANGGFLNGYQCPTRGVIFYGVGECPPDENGNVEDPDIITPGNTLQAQLDEAINSGRDLLETVDEVSDMVFGTGSRILGAIFGSNEAVAAGANVAKGGLLGLGANSGLCRSGGNSQNCDDFGLVGSPIQQYGAYQGNDPLGYLAELIADQVETEQEVVDQLTLFRATYESPLNQTLVDHSQQCVEFMQADNRNEDSRILADVLNDYIDIPNQIFNSDIEVVERGPQKVDWAGNNFEWQAGRIYGLQECSGDVYRDREGDHRRWVYRADPRYSYSISHDEETGNWQWNIFACVAMDDRKRGQGSDFNFRKVPYSPPAYRAPDNRRKIDWNGRPLDWSNVDRYEEQFRYGSNQCDSRTVGEYSYTVGNVIKVKQSARENKDKKRLDAVVPVQGGAKHGQVALPQDLHNKVQRLLFHQLNFMYHRISNHHYYDLLWYEVEPGTENTWYRHECRPVQWTEYHEGIERNWIEEFTNHVPYKNGSVVSRSEAAGSARVPLSQALNFDDYIAERTELINGLLGICQAESYDPDTLEAQCDQAIAINGTDQSNFDQARQKYERLSGRFISSTQKRRITNIINAGIGDNTNEQSGLLGDLSNAFSLLQCNQYPLENRPIGFENDNPNEEFTDPNDDFPNDDEDPSDNPDEDLPTDDDPDPNDDEPVNGGGGSDDGGNSDDNSAQ